MQVLLNIPFWAVLLWNVTEQRQTFYLTDLNIKYTIDLDKDKDKLRRMFFWDELNKRKQFALETNYTLAASNKKYRLAPKTVYLVW